MDYVALRRSFHGGGGEVVTTPIPYEGLPPVAADFNASGLRAAILDSRKHGQPYWNSPDVRWRPTSKATARSYAASE